MPRLALFAAPRARRFCLLASLALGAAGFRWLPPDDDLAVLRHLVRSTQQFYEQSRPETTYLHLDKATYTTGETVWLRAYVADADRHQLDTLSKVLYVELLSDRQQVVSRRTLELTGGLGSGSLALADTLTPGTYLLRAYTNWMRNAGPALFYTRRLQVWPATEPEPLPTNRADFQRITKQAQQRTARVGLPPNVQFFAEGGNLVAGLDNVVAFKAVDYAGHGLAVAGQVLDAQGQVVATFQSRHAGMGTLRLRPVAGQRYHAVFSSPALAAASVALPAVQASGYVLQVVPSATEFEVNIQQYGGAGGPVVLLGQVGSAVGYLGRGAVQGQAAFTAHIPKRKFAAGIVHFTLFDGQGKPLAERLAFARHEGPLRISLLPDRAAYGPHQPVRVRVAVADAAGQPVATQLSVAVADAAASGATDNIAARLLLTADLGGYVEEPGYYFDNPTAETDQALDDLLLTQGWRRFAWEKVLAGPPAAPDYGVERSLGLRGQVTQRNGQPAAHSTLTFLQAKPSKLAIPTITDDAGRFLFNGFGGCDTVRATLQARSERGRPNVRIALDAPPAWPALPLPPLPAAPPAALAPAIRRSQQQRAAERAYLSSIGQTIQLNNVTVLGQHTTIEDPRRAFPASVMMTVVDMNTIPSARTSSASLLQSLQNRIPGVTISGTEPNMTISMRGNRSFSGANTPLVILDGARTTISALAMYQAADVERVEILKPGQATIFGGDGADGVVAVYTRRGNPTYDPRHDPTNLTTDVLAVQLPGYNCPQQFYAPRYAPGAPAAARPDTRRATLYWAPNLRTDASGQTEFTFYTSEATGSFRLTAEGLSASGQPALGGNLLEVK